MGRRSREKGASWERVVARTLSQATGLDIRRTSGQSRKGTDAPDVEAPGVWLECHAAAAHDYKPEKKMEQATKATDGRPPVAICKLDRHKPIAMMRLRTLTVLWGVSVVGMPDLGPLVTLALDDFVRLYVATYADQSL